MANSNNISKIFLVSVVTLLISACNPNIGGEAKYPTGMERSGTNENDIYNEQATVFGNDSSLFNFGGDKDKDSSGSGIGVNSFLWRASLDTVSFLPITSADPFGGTILTDWYTPAETSNERFKVNVFILGRQLRSDGIRVRTFKQKLQNGAWIDANVSEETSSQLEDAILTRARQLRIAQIDQN